MTLQETTPVVEALRLAASATRTPDQVITGYPHVGMCRVSSGPCICATRILVVSYCRHFEFLWSDRSASGGRSLVDWLLTDRKDAERTVILVDDRPAASDSHGILVGEHTTPYDWAVAISLWATASLWTEESVLRQGLLKDMRCPARNSIPRLRVLVVTPEQSIATTSTSRLRFGAVAQSLPWVQGYGALGRDHMTLCALPSNDAVALAYLRTAVPLGSFGFQHLLDDISRPERVADLRSVVDDAPESTAAGLRAVAAVWLADLVKPETRHAVANYLGPALLAEALPEDLRSGVMPVITEGSAERIALRMLCGLVGLGSGAATGAKVPVKGVLASRKGNPFGARAPDFLLVDDQFALGYAHLLGAVLFGNRGVATGRDATCDLTINATAGRLKCLSWPGYLIDELGASPVADWSAPRVLGWRGGKLAGVFLDLRLWAHTEEASAVQAPIADAAERLGARSTKDRYLVSSLNAVREGRPHSTEAITLLPLLLSHYDASLPIVLFSSTHQREVIEVLQHRHNIITMFSKPLLSSAGPVGGELHLLTTAVAEALRLQAGRHLWGRIVALELAAERPLPDPVELVRKTLADFVWGYLIDRRPYDFLSVPWEYLEARVGFARVGNDSEHKQRWEAMRVWAGDREPLLSAIRHVRNRKTHGVHWLRAGQGDSNALEEAGVILCSLLVDLLDRRVTNAPRWGNEVEKLVRRARTRWPAAFGGDGVADVGRVFADAAVDWSVFLALTFLSVVQRRVPMDRDTWTACCDYIDRRIGP